AGRPAVGLLLRPRHGRRWKGRLGRPRHRTPAGWHQWSANPGAAHAAISGLLHGHGPCRLPALDDLGRAGTSSWDGKHIELCANQVVKGAQVAERELKRVRFERVLVHTDVTRGVWRSH